MERSMGTRAIYQSGPSLFKTLVRLVARTFYSGPCPPKPDGQLSRKKWDKVNTTGLAVVILDHLAQREWVREEHLLQELQIAPKLMLRALRYLEQERILRHDSRKEGKRAQAKDIVILATKKPSTGGDTAEAEAPAKPLLQTYWAIDYPSFWEALRLRLYLMRYKIKSEVEDARSVADFVCPKCGNRYSTLDFVNIFNRQTGQMMCEDCGIEVLEEFGNKGGICKVGDRSKRRDVQQTHDSQRTDTGPLEHDGFRIRHARTLGTHDRQRKPSRKTLDLQNVHTFFPFVI